MASTAIEDISSVFLEYGYILEVPPPNFHPQFVKNFETKYGTVEIVFFQIDPEFINLPKATVRSLPPSLRGRRLSHIEENSNLCYANKESTNIFPLNAKSAAATCITLVDQIINDWQRNRIDEDIAAEFTAYWDSQINIYDGGENEAGYAIAFRRLNLEKREDIEFFQADSLEACNDWFSLRGGKDFIVNGMRTISVKLTNYPFIPSDNVWPLKSFKAFSAWLKKIDPNAHHNLVNKLLRYVKKENTVIIKLTYENESIGVQVTITQEGLRMLNRKRQLTKQKTRKGKRTKSSHDQIMLSLGSSAHCNLFNRVVFVPVTSSFIVNRNLSDEISLAGKRIALIGCGTIGGYAAQSLLHVGAGSGLGTLAVFDSDYFSAGNVGRHLLGKKYLGEKKSVAIKDFLLQQGLTENISAHGNFGPADLHLHWDCIINTTGDDTFSIHLTRWFRSQEWKLVKPDLVHCWIDGYGEAVRILRDNGQDGCYGCLSNFSENLDKRSPRYDLFTKDNIPEHASRFRRACSKTYMPFGTQPGLTAAGMIQSMIVKTNSNITFRQIALSDRVLRVKDSKLSSSVSCPVCQM